MLNFCPLCVAEVYTLRCDAMEDYAKKCKYTNHYLLFSIRKTFIKSFRSPSRTPCVSDVS